MNSHIGTIKISFVKQEDYPQWLNHWKDYQTFYKVKLSDDITSVTWSRFFDEHEKIYCAVARDGDRILGFVHFLYHHSTWAINNYCYLEDLFVLQNIRGRQIGKKLIEFVNQHAENTNAARLYWHTQQSNVTAQRLYNWVAENPGVIEYRISL